MDHYKELYKVEQLPVFQNRLYSSENAAKNCIKGNIDLVQDLKTGLVFNRMFNNSLMRYDAEYQNEQALSHQFQLHLNTVSKIIARNFADKTLIEVGCGKGFFLEYLQNLSFNVTGFDPTYEGSNQNIVKEYFSPELNLRADGIILRHVLEHVPDPVDFLAKISRSNGNKGKIYIEIPCFDWICKQRAWFDIFYEHVNYFRINDFYRIFGKVYETGHLFNGQYLYVVADLASLQTPIFDEQCYFDFPANFLSSVSEFAERLQINSDKIPLIWGGASKGVIFAIFMSRAGVDIKYITDINPAKQGKYLPVTALLVQKPKEIIKQLHSNTDVYVVNSNYLEEIVKFTNNKYNYIAVDK